jgi:hypothetical protein
MASDLGREAKDAILVKIKEQADSISQAYDGNPSAAAALRDLAQAYALLERPIGGTNR